MNVHEIHLFMVILQAGCASEASWWSVVGAGKKDDEINVSKAYAYIQNENTNCPDLFSLNEWIMRRTIFHFPSLSLRLSLFLSFTHFIVFLCQGKRMRVRHQLTVVSIEIY